MAHRINSITADANANGAGKAGFTDGDPGLSIPPTNFKAAWCNSVQEELCNFVEKSGATLSTSDNGQLYRCMQAMVQRLALANHSAITGPASAYHYEGAAVVNDIAVLLSQDNRVVTSADGITWTEVLPTGSGNISGSFYSIAFGATLYVAVGASSLSGNAGQIYSSPDLATWTNRGTSLAGGFLTSVVFGGGHFVAVGSQGRIKTSPDGTTWTNQTQASSYSGTFKGVVRGGSVYVAVGTSGAIQTSADGVTWASRTAAAGFAGTWEGVSYGSGVFVAVGTGGEIQTSTDGVTWTQRQASGSTPDLKDVCWTGAMFVAVGLSGIVMSSVDGSAWQTHRLPGYTTSLYSCCATSKFIAIGGGTGATIRRSLTLS